MREQYQAHFSLEAELSKAQFSFFELVALILASVWAQSSILAGAPLSSVLAEAPLSSILAEVPLLISRAAFVPEGEMVVSHFSEGGLNGSLNFEKEVCLIVLEVEFSFVHAVESSAIESRPCWNFLWSSLVQLVIAQADSRY